MSGGDILNTGNTRILHKGVCWSTHPNPTVDDQQSENNIYNYLYLEFYILLNELEPGKTYYIRAFATNIVGTGYGNEIAITMPEADVYDIDGNPYSSVTIGMQQWTVENLRTTRYANGDAIPESTNLDEWRNLTTAAWGYAENDPQFENPYGKLYNWFAVSDPENLCPTGWHLPSDEEWSTLVDFLGGGSVAGGKLKESGSLHWASPNYGSTNSTGFTALPGGSRSGDFYLHVVGMNGIFWSNTAYNNDSAYYYALGYNVEINRGTNVKQFGFSVRCIKNN
jgi:uncharacterized protein (TIGR02145 family)